MADRVKAESSRNPLPSFVNVIVNVNEQPTSGRAFSLVELLAVVGIIAIVSVAAVPVMRGLGGSQSSRGAAQVLVSALEQARTAAILSGTNAYLGLPGSNFPASDYRFRSYAIVRQAVDQDGNGLDDFQTNVSTNSGWVLLSKWERLPGDLRFSPTRLGTLESTNVSGIPVPGNPASGSYRLQLVGFTPSGGLTPNSFTNTTNVIIGLLFASSNKISNNLAQVADLIEVSFYSGRVRYVGLTNNVEF